MQQNDVMGGRLVAGAHPHSALFGRGELPMDHLAQSFDLTNGWNLLRIACGVFFIPHLIAKFTQRAFALDFFRKVGLRPPEAWLYAALGIEVVVTFGLVFAVLTFYAALLAAVFLGVAAVATWRFSRGRWLWNLGGCEYPLFWGLACLVVAMQSRPF